MTAGGFPHSETLGSKPCWRLPEDIAASNVLHRYCLPRHPPYALASNTHHETAWPQDFLIANSQTTNHHTKNDHKTIDLETNNRVRFEITAKQRFKNPCFARVHYPVLKPPRTATHRAGTRQAPGTTGHRTAPQSLGWRSGSPKAHPYHPAPTARSKANDSSTPATPPPSHHATRGAHTVTNIRLNSP